MSFIPNMDKVKTKEDFIFHNLNKDDYIKLFTIYIYIKKREDDVMKRLEESLSWKAKVISKL